MKKLKLTPWFDGTIKPVNAGEYDVVFSIFGLPIKHRLLFDGRYWKWRDKTTIFVANNDGNTFKWRGIQKWVK